MTGTVLERGDRIFRYEVPVDDRWHEFSLRGTAAPLAVACRNEGVVEFWAPANEDSAVVIVRSFIVVGTGHVIPAKVRYWGTVLDLGGALVWHLLERRP